MRNKIINIFENNQQQIGEDVGVGASMYGVMADKVIEVVKGDKDFITQQAIKYFKAHLNGISDSYREAVSANYSKMVDEIKKAIEVLEEMG